MSTLLAFAFCLLPQFCFGEVQAPSNAEIEKLVAELDDENYQTRERATAELIKIGEPAVAPLKMAYLGSDEAKWRATTILKQIALAGEDSAYTKVTKVFETLSDKERYQGESILANLVARRTNYQNRIATKLLESKGGSFGRDDAAELAISYVPGTQLKTGHVAVPIPALLSPASGIDPTFFEGVIEIEEPSYETYDGPAIMEPPSLPSIPADIEHILEIKPESSEEPVEVEPTEVEPTESAEVLPEDSVAKELRFTEKDADEIIELIEATIDPVIEGPIEPSSWIDSSSIPSGYSVFVPATVSTDFGTPVSGDVYLSGPDVGFLPIDGSGRIYSPYSHVPQVQNPDNTLVLAKDWHGNDDDLKAIGKLAYVTSIVVNSLELSPKAVQLLFTAPNLRRVIFTNTRFHAASLEQELARHQDVKVLFYGQAALGVAGNVTAIPFQVERVHPDSGAAAGGIKPGDTLLEVNGLKILNFMMLTRLVAGKYPGDKVQVTVQRDGKPLTLTCKLNHRDALKIYDQNDPGYFGESVIERTSITALAA